MIGDFLKPPTDNLYKFMCICGLILFLLSVTYPPWLLNKITYSYFENKRDFDILTIDLEDLKSKRERLYAEQDALDKERATLSQQLDRLISSSAKGHLTRADKSALSSDINRAKEVQSQIEDKHTKLNETGLALLETASANQKKSVELRYKLEAAIWDSRSAKAITILSLFLATVGVILGRKGFNLWSLRVQVFQDAILKKQAEGEAGLTKNPPIPRNRFGFKGWR